jgi:ADP-heptose:LPS heptosyltransferase
MEFHPPDSERAAITQRLIEQVDWLGAELLVVLHPGSGQSPLGSDEQKRWPAARFALLGNHLARRHGARVLIAGSHEDRAIAQAVGGMISAPTVNLAGQLTLGELGALCEVADLFVGMDSGSTHVAAAVNCPTLALYGATRAEITRPYTRPGRVVVLEAQKTQPFTWQSNLPPEEVIAAADQLLVATRSRVVAG